jgi:hypothetical protein
MGDLVDQANADAEADLYIRRGTRAVSRSRTMLRLQIHAAQQVGEARVGAHRLGVWTLRISKDTESV